MSEHVSSLTTRILALALALTLALSLALTGYHPRPNVSCVDGSEEEAEGEAEGGQEEQGGNHQAGVSAGLLNDHSSF